jgi:hypothetical protein
VRTTAKVNVLSAPSASGKTIGTQPKGATGTVSGGPVHWNNQWWWNVDFAARSDGWVTETKLKKIV